MFSQHYAPSTSCTLLRSTTSSHLPSLAAGLGETPLMQYCWWPTKSRMPGEEANWLWHNVQGAFSHMVKEQLIHNMHLRRVANCFINIVILSLTGRTTHLKFDNYLSEPIQLINGTTQGDPSSMLYYSFYNMPLIKTASSRDELWVRCQLYVSYWQFNQTVSHKANRHDGASRGWFWLVIYSQFSTTLYMSRWCPSHPLISLKYESRHMLNHLIWIRLSNSQRDFAHSHLFLNVCLDKVEDDTLYHLVLDTLFLDQVSNVQMNSVIPIVICHPSTPNTYF